MSISKTRTIQWLAALGSIALGLAVPSAAFAGTMSYECILDTDDGGSSQNTDDTDSGADANNDSTNLACGDSAVAGAGGDNTALGSASMAGIGAGANENTAVGHVAEAGLGADADDNAAFGENSEAGLGADADGNTALGQGSDAGLGADADFNTAVGEDSRAGVGDGKTRNTAIGQAAEANASGSDGATAATAVGASAMANFDRSAAFGADAVATRANQMVYGTETETHTMPGIVSDASRAAQTGTLQVVTADAMGNLAGDGGEIFGRIRANADDIDDNAEGVAMAMSIQDPDLVGDERLGLKVGWGTFSGENAMGVALSGVVLPDIGAGIRLGLAGGAAFGLDRGGIGGRAGFQLSW